MKHNMTGIRKLIIGILSLLVFLTILLVHPEINSLELGMGISFIDGTIIYGYYKEYFSKKD